MTDRTSPHHPVWLWELQGLLLAGESLETFLGRVVVIAQETVPEAYGCGVRLHHGNHVLTAVGDESVRGPEAGQDDLADGPAIATFQDGRPRYVADLCRDQRWPEFSRQACAAGAGCLLTDVLETPQHQRVGTVSFYSRQVDAFDPGVRERAHRFAGHAGLAASVALAFLHQVELAQDLRRALGTRSVIDQALGVIMAEDRCAPETAFDALRRASMNRNVKVHALAADIVQGVSGKPPSDPPFASRALAG